MLIVPSRISAPGNQDLSCNRATNWQGQETVSLQMGSEGFLNLCILLEMKKHIPQPKDSTRPCKMCSQVGVLNDSSVSHFFPLSGRLLRVMFVHDAGGPKFIYPVLHFLAKNKRGFFDLKHCCEKPVLAS